MRPNEEDERKENHCRLRLESTASSCLKAQNTEASAWPQASTLEALILRDLASGLADLKKCLT